MAAKKLNNIFAQDGIYYHQYKLDNIKYELRKKRLLPLIKDNELYIYKIRTNSIEFLKIMNYLSKNYKEYYNQIIDKNDYNNPYQKVKLTGLDSIQSVRIPTNEDIIRCYHLNNENIKEQMLKDDAGSNLTATTKKIDVELELHKMIDKIKSTSFLARIKREPKLYQLFYTTLFEVDPDLCLDFIAKQLCEYIYNTSIDFIKDQKIFSIVLDEINNMEYNKLEKDLSIKEKYSILKGIYNSLNIECLYNRKVVYATNNDFKFISSTIRKDDIIEIARNNSYILYNSEFANIFSLIKEPAVTKQKVK